MSIQTKHSHIYISSQNKLEKAVHELSTSTCLSVDLEFDKNRFRYGFNLCLIQIFDGKSTYLIDPINNELNLSPIFEVFENPEVTKIVFSFGEDQRLLHSLGCYPIGLYDLQIASALLNFPPSSLATLLEQVLEIQLSKTSQQSNWFKRPLTAEQIDYAIEDVIHLPKLYEVFLNEAEKRGVSDWIQQEMNFFESVNHEDATQNEILKEKYKGDMNEVEWHIFSKLMHLREQHAESINRPPYHIAERGTLTLIAKNPVYADRWMATKSNHHTTKNPEFLDRLVKEIESAKREAKDLELSTRKRATNKPSKEEYQQIRAFEQKVKYAKQHFFKPIQKALDQQHGEYTRAFILNNRLIKELVSGNTSILLNYKKLLIKSIITELHLEGDIFIPNYSEL